MPVSKEEKVVAVNATISKKQLEWLREKVKEENYSSVSHAIRAILKEKMDSN